MVGLDWVELASGLNSHGCYSKVFFFFLVDNGTQRLDVKRSTESVIEMLLLEESVSFHFQLLLKCNGQHKRDMTL